MRRNSAHNEPIARRIWAGLFTLLMAAIFTLGVLTDAIGASTSASVQALVRNRLTNHIPPPNSPIWDAVLLPSGTSGGTSIGSFCEGEPAVVARQTFNAVLTGTTRIVPSDYCEEFGLTCPDHPWTDLAFTQYGNNTFTMTAFLNEEATPVITSPTSVVTYRIDPNTPLVVDLCTPELDGTYEYFNVDPQKGDHCVGKIFGVDLSGLSPGDYTLRTVLESEHAGTFSTRIGYFTVNDCTP